MAIINIFPQAVEAQQVGNPQNAATTVISNIPPKIISVSFARKRIKYIMQEVSWTTNIRRGGFPSFDSVNERVKRRGEMIGIIKRIEYNDEIINNSAEYDAFLERIGRRRVQVQIYYDSEVSKEVYFDDIRKIYMGIDIEADDTSYGSTASLDEYIYCDTYIKVETEGMDGKNIKLQIQQPQANTLLSNPLNIIHVIGNSSTDSNETRNQTNEIEMTVERYDNGQTYTNIADWDNYAIAKVIMLPDQDVRGANQHQWRNLINTSQSIENNLRSIDLFFWINNVEGINNMTYEGTLNNLGEEGQNGNLAGFKSNQGYFKMFNQRAPWMQLAFEEALKAKGAKEGEDPLEDRVEQHYQAYTRSRRDSTGRAWCASFINWVIGNTGYNSVRQGGQRSRSFWQDNLRAGIYEQITEPFFGAIMVRRNYRQSSSGEWNIPGGTGHVTFICGIIRGTNDYICLGGNQGNRLIFKRYSADTNTFSGTFNIAVNGVKQLHKQRFLCFVKPTEYIIKDSDRLLEFLTDQTDNLNTRFFHVASSGDGTR